MLLFPGDECNAYCKRRAQGIETVPGYFCERGSIRIDKASNILGSGSSRGNRDIEMAVDFRAG